MAPINPVVQQAAPSDSTQRLASKTRLGVSSFIGAAFVLGAGAAATRYVGFDNVVKAVEGFASKYATLPDLATAANGFFAKLAGYGTITVLGAAAGAAGALAGAGVGKATAHKASLNDVKGQLGVDGSDLNFGQIHRVADVAVQGGVFKGRSTVAQFKSDADRIQNLNGELTQTEFSLSSNAHNTSKARGTEDRFFDFEGARLANRPQSTAQFVNALQDLRAAVHSEVKATDKYTYQKGNSATAVSRREYILAGVMGFAYDRGLAGNYLTAAVAERAETAKTNPKLADAQFRQALQQGIAAGILSPKNDPRAYEGMVRAAAAASQASTSGRNRDAIVSSIFDSLKDAGLIDGNLRARFIKDVQAKLQNPGAQISNQIQQSGSESLIDRLVKRSGVDASSRASSSDSKGSSASLEEGMDDPSVETASQLKARLAAEEQAQADSDVNAYSDSLGRLDPRLKQIADLYETLITLLREKSVPLNQIMEMGPNRLRGALVLRHKEGFDLFEKYEANDASIQATREQIASLQAGLDADRVARPDNFKRASKAQRRAAEDLEKQIKAGDAQIAKLKAKAGEVDASIKKKESVLGQNEDHANTFLFPKTEEALPEPELPRQPGFFERLFGAKKKAEAPAVEEAGIDSEVAVEEILGDPVVEGNPPGGPQIVDLEGPLPDPVVAPVKPRWKFWS